MCPVLLLASLGFEGTCTVTLRRAKPSRFIIRAKEMECLEILSAGGGMLMSPSLGTYNINRLSVKTLATALLPEA